MNNRLLRPTALSLVVTVAAAAFALADAPSLEVQRRAWKRLQQLNIPGVALVQQFNVQGKAFYVSPDGDDEADGSQDHPWRTLAKASVELGPSRVIYLHAGTYDGPVAIRKVRATAESPTALRAMPGEEVIVRYPAAWIAAELAAIDHVQLEGRRITYNDKGEEIHYKPLINVTDSAYVEISGLHLIGARRELPHNLYSENGVGFSHGSENCRVLNNEIENVGHCGVKGGSHVLVEGNWIHDVGQTFHDHGGYFGGKNVVFRRNLVVGVAGWGVHGYKSPQQMQVTHNIFMHARMHGVLIGGADSLVAHNVFADNAKGGVFLFRRQCHGNRVINNIFLGPEPAISMDDKGGAPGAAPTENVFDHNLVEHGVKLTARPLPENTIGNGNVRAVALLVDRDQLDFRPKPGSPAVGAGMPLDGGARQVNIGLCSAPEGK